MSMKRAGALTVSLAFLAFGCGDDATTAGPGTTAAGAGDTSDTTEMEDMPGMTDGESAAGADSEYCILAAELDAQESFPSAEQLEAIDALAPDEIAEEVHEVVAALQDAEDPGAAFADPAVQEAFGPIEAYEAEVCGLEVDEDEEQDPSVTELDPDAAQVAVSAVEYDFIFEDPAAGPTSFTMTNDGEEAHVMVIFKLVEGSTLEDALAAEDESELIEEEFESDVVVPGGEAVVTAELTAGEWGMICYLPTPEGEPHLAVGMAVPFTVE